MARTGVVYIGTTRAGLIQEDEAGITFAYDVEYLSRADAVPISFTLPLRQEPFPSKTMLPFFDGLIPEGWLLDIAAKSWKIDLRDRMGLLLTVCRDTIGAVSVVNIEEAY